MLTLTHSSAEGTLLHGTVRGDASRDVLRGMYAGWDWSKRIGLSGCWFIRNSRDRSPNLYEIERTAEKLRAAGFEVEVQVDAAPRLMEEAEADRAVRMEDRADALDEKARRLDAAARGRRDAEHAILDFIPPGQPILVGHHSEGRHRRDLARADAHRRAARDLGNRAETAAQRAESAEQHMTRRENPVTVANRIQKLEADIRRFERAMTPCPRSGRRMKPEAEGRTITCSECYTDHTVGADLLFPTHGAATGAYLVQLEANLAHAQEQLRYWQTVREQQIAAGVATNYGPETVKKGDFVFWFREWRPVLRVNPKTATVPHLLSELQQFGHTSTAPWQEIKDHVSLAELEEAEETPAVQSA